MKIKQMWSKQLNHKHKQINTTLSKLSEYFSQNAVIHSHHTLVWYTQQVCVPLKMYG